ncbi:MAG: glycosyl hydrolase, partial [bacterium]
DIIGYDSYPGDFNYGIQKTMFDGLYKITGGQKLIAMTENGPIPDPDACLEEDAPWLLFMAWSDLVSSQNSEQHIKDVYNNTNVLTLESDNEITGPEWRSSLYPEDWRPGYQDEYGRYLHDFSYAGYHKSEIDIPFISENILDVTHAPYNADNTGNDDVTVIIQQALDDVGASGGGVVYLPAGTYRIKPQASNDYALRIRYDSTVLRGAGPDKSFIWNDETFMRQKDIILVNKSWSGWFGNFGSTTKVAKDILLPTRIIPVESVSGFKKGDNIVITNPATDAFIEEHDMTGDWKQSAIKGVAFKRLIDSIDIDNNLIFIDSPTRYFLKTRDNASVSHAGEHLRECGIEYLSIGNTENPKTGWDEESYSTSGTGAYDVHFSQAISMEYVEDSWIRNVHSYKPELNTLDFHILSNCLILRSCRQVTVDSSFFQKPQYEGGGGNGYMFTLESNDCLIKNSRANHSRHNYDFKYPFSNGNVIHNCRGENSKYSSDFHMFLSMSNLFDVFTVNGDYLESMFRPWGGNWSIHGYSSTESVFYNTYGEAYHPDRDYIVESRQYKWGYIIGTSGPANRVKTEPVSGTTNGFSYDTAPEDMVEGVGMGQDLRPASLYLDQLEKRTKDYPGIGVFDVTIELRDEISNDLIDGIDVIIYNDTISTNSSGKALFSDVLNSFYLSIDGGNYRDISERQLVIYSDTSLVFYLERNNYDVSLRLYDESDLEPFWGANVRLSGTTKVTDSEGIVKFNVPEGEHEYSIDKVSYRQETGTLAVHSDTVIDFFLVRTHANIKFRLREGTTPVNNVIVKLEEDSLLSNSLGLAEFRQKSVGENYTYSIRKEDYHKNEGSIYLTTDTTVNIEMLKKPSGINKTYPEDNFHFWPNPVEDELFCRFKYYSPGVRLKITDLKGREIIIIDDPGIQELIINTSNMDPGLYVLEYSSLEMHKSFLLVIR